MILTDDITYCLNSDDCSILQCPRHSCNIKDKTIPHSYAAFCETKNCMIYNSPSKYDDCKTKIIEELDNIANNHYDDTITTKLKNIIKRIEENL